MSDETAPAPAGTSPIPPLRAGAHPDRIGPYRIVRILGQGRYEEAGEDCCARWWRSTRCCSARAAAAGAQ